MAELFEACLAANCALQLSLCPLKVETGCTGSSGKGTGLCR